MAWLFLDTHASNQLRLGWLDGSSVDVKTYEGRAHDILPKLKDQADRQKVEGICVVAGPGRFTAIRTGVLHANLWALWLSIPLVGVTVEQADDLVRLSEELSRGKHAPMSYIAPVYDAEPNITAPSRP